ncbi:MAG: hypothetical protein QOG72_193 [Sphingomonadales bacterium]|nr:hypothetical protein [Sphingomonadales bacterium]
MRAAARAMVAISLIFGLAHPLVATVSLDPATSIAAKGAAVGLLALAAWLEARTADGWLLAALLALGSTGDVLIELDLGAGAAAFAAAHLISILLYLRNRRTAVRPWLWALAASLPVSAAALAFLLCRGAPEAGVFASYALLLGTMTAAAWLSRFPRSVGLGASLFLASDMLIAARLGSGADLSYLNAAVWLLYYVGQLAIFTGVRAHLSRGGEDHSPGVPVGRSG